MTGIGAVFALVMLFSLGECDDDAPLKAASFPKYISIIADKCDQFERAMKDATLVYPALISSEETLVLGLDKFKWKINYIRDVLFRKSGEYKGRVYYYMPEIYEFEVSMAEALCNFYDGYLAEITDDGEYDFVKKFLANETEWDNDVFIVISGTDEVTEQLWRYSSSGERISYLPWAKNAPGPEDCLSMVPSEDFKFQAVACTTWNTRYGFLCEVGGL